jgi:hypothetical protein
VNQFWQAPQVTLSSESQILSASSLFRPGPDLTFGLDTQFEWTRQEGVGQVANQINSPTITFLTNTVMENANFDEFKSAQNAQLRFTKIPWTVLFADARFEQDENMTFENGTIDGPATLFNFQTDSQNTQYDARTGFTSSPWNWISLNSQYEYNASHTSYNDVFNSVPDRYPGFILNRTIKTGDLDTKLVLRPVRWLRTTFDYKVESTDFSTATEPYLGLSPGGPLLAGKYQAHTYGFSSALNPLARLNMTGSLTYSDSRIWTFDNDNPSVVPYKGGTYMVNVTAVYAINLKTDLSASYYFAQSDYGQNNGVAGVPLGVDYTRHTATVAIVEHFSPKVAGAVRYSFYTYSEPTADGLADYTAQGIFASLTFRWP